MEKSLDYKQLTPGIRNVVRLLRDNGFATSDSGDGVTNVALGMEGALEVPHVHVDLGTDDDIDPAAARRWAMRMAELFALKGILHLTSVQLVYSPIDHRWMLSVYGVCDSDLER